MTVRVSQTSSTQRGEYFNMSDFLQMLCLMPHENDVYDVYDVYEH